MINLKQWRDDLALSQPQMARYLRVPVSTYRNWEQGINAPGSVGNAYIDLLRSLEDNEATAWQIVSQRLDEVGTP